jgi:hypothetical protein
MKSARGYVGTGCPAKQGQAILYPNCPQACRGIPRRGLQACSTAAAAAAATKGEPEDEMKMRMMMKAKENTTLSLDAKSRTMLGGELHFQFPQHLPPTTAAR